MIPLSASIQSSMKIINTALNQKLMLYDKLAEYVYPRLPVSLLLILTEGPKLRDG